MHRRVDRARGGTATPRVEACWFRETQNVEKKLTDYGKKSLLATAAGRLGNQEEGQKVMLDPRRCRVRIDDLIEAGQHEGLTDGCRWRRARFVVACHLPG